MFEIVLVEPKNTMCARERVNQMVYASVCICMRAYVCMCMFVCQLQGHSGASKSCSGPQLVQNQRLRRLLDIVVLCESGIIGVELRPAEGDVSVIVCCCHPGKEKYV